MENRSTPEHTPRAAIVLLAYNSLPLVQKFLPEIINTVPHDEDHVITVVDNASEDGLGTWMRENHPDIRVIRLKVNRGFTNGYRESLPLIRARNYVLISSDIEVTPGWLEPALSLLESSDSTAAVQPKIKSYDRRDEFEYAGAAGGFIDVLGFPFCRGRILDHVEKDNGQYDDVAQIFWASGACLFINADLYHKAGGLDNDYYAHFEEIDLAWRLQRMGYKIMYCPKSEVYHMGGSVIKYGSPGKVYRNHRNSLITILKNMATSKLIFVLPLRILLDYLAALTMVLRGDSRAAAAVFKAHRAFFGNWKTWMRKRRELARLPRDSKAVYGIWNRSILVEYFIKRKKTFTRLKTGF